MKKLTSFKLAVMAIGIAINVVAPFIAMTCRIPIYLDAIGTNLIAMLMGPTEGVIVGVLGSLLCGVIFDPSSFYYAVVQVFNGIAIALLYRKGWIDMKKMFWSMLIVIIFVSTSSALITVYVYGGITPSASTYVYLFLKYLGFSPVVAAVIMQFMTDYGNQLFCTGVSLIIMKRMSSTMKNRLK
ncbi:ECF transporter S component [Clostridium mediterraneense]|uniref:ECF transporter S component n=1 Tax=Clostridium mediterraneense TaxID=1805472 RepID=UPI0008320B49|nr:ECF transporter S component [Clostridium mediterraneense]